MGYPNTLNLDAVTVAAVAGRLDGVAETLYGARAGLRFDDRAAGRAYAAEGALIANRLDGLLGELTGWARSVEQIGYGLRCSTIRYADAERLAVGLVSRP